jgi:dihydroflavonol-4-reductase
VHCAALYSFAPRDRAMMRRVNVVGTASLMEAARIAGVERAVHTSSSATLGASHDGVPRTETDFAPEGRSDGYHHSKVEQERAALAGRVPVVALLPTAPVGPGDWKPTPTGQMILDFARGKMFAKPPRGGLNLVPVEDVARAHVAALQAGVPGERYILGAENLLLDDVWQLLSGVTGKPMPRWRVLDGVALAIAQMDELRCRMQKHAQPFVPVEGVRMARERMFADSSKARRDLRFAPGSVRDALSRAVEWYRTNRYVTS